MFLPTLKLTTLLTEVKHRYLGNILGGTCIVGTFVLFIVGHLNTQRKFICVSAPSLTKC